MAIRYLRLEAVEEEAKINQKQQQQQQQQQQLGLQTIFWCACFGCCFTLFLLYNSIMLDIFKANFMWNQRHEVANVPSTAAADPSSSSMVPSTSSAIDTKGLEAINANILNALEKAYKKTIDRPDCQRILDGDEKYTKKAVKNRVKFNADPPLANLPMDCRSIRARHHFVESPLSEQEANFPIAYARIVNQDYYFVEAEFATNYQPQNWYCFMVDAKVTPDFRARMHALADCLPNVLVPRREYDVDSAGHRMGLATMECLNLLAQADKHWEYVFILQNHDVQIKSNQELVQILQWLDGANDMQFNHKPSYAQNMIHELHAKYDWSFQALGLFRNATLNQQPNAVGHPPSLRLAKGLVQAALVRSFVDFVVQQLNVSQLLARLDTRKYGADELFLPTLTAADDLNAPGAFTHKCYDQRVFVPYITRYTHWSRKNCHSGIIRHNICIFGLEDLATHIRDNKQLFANKLMPYADLGAILCWHQEMRRRTLLDRGLHRLDPANYQNWPQTIFARQWRRSAGNVDLANFECKKSMR